MTDDSAVASVKAAKAPWSRGKKWAVGGASTFAALWAMGTVSDAVGPDTIIETVTTTVTETPPAVTETQTVVETTTETQTVTEEAPAPLTKAPETMAPSSAPVPAAAPPHTQPVTRTARLFERQALRPSIAASLGTRPRWTVTAMGWRARSDASGPSRNFLANIQKILTCI